MLFLSLSSTNALAEIELDESKLDDLPLTKRLIQTAADGMFTYGGLLLLGGGLFVFIKSLIDKENRNISWKALAGAILGAGMAAMAGELTGLITK